MSHDRIFQSEGESLMNIALLITSLGLAIFLFVLLLLALRIERRDRKELFKRIRETKHTYDLTSDLPPMGFASDDTE